MKTKITLFTTLLFLNNIFSQVQQREIENFDNSMKTCTHDFLIYSPRNFHIKYSNTNSEQHMVESNIKLQFLIKCGLETVTYSYSARVTFYMHPRDYKCFAKIDSVYCNHVNSSQNKCRPIQIQEEYNKSFGIDKESFDLLKERLNNELINILDEYKLYLDKECKRAE